MEFRELREKNQKEWNSEILLQLSPEKNIFLAKISNFAPKLDPNDLIGAKRIRKQIFLKLHLNFFLHRIYFEKNDLVEKKLISQFDNNLVLS